jgi:hypothetical protein
MLTAMHRATSGINRCFVKISFTYSFKYLQLNTPIMAKLAFQVCGFAVIISVLPATDFDTTAKNFSLVLWCCRQNRFLCDNLSYSLQICLKF